jgi:carboxypeptidase Taq
MTTAWEQLQPKLKELHDLTSATALMYWDMHVMMPSGGAEARARAVATMRALLHQRITDPDLGELIDQLRNDDSLDDDQRASVRILWRDYDKATRIPESLVRELAEATGRANKLWIDAKTGSDFSIFQPILERIIELKKQEAEALGYENEPYDALLDNFEPGMTTAEVADMFEQLTEGLRPIVGPIVDAMPPKPAWLSADYDAHTQMDFSQWLIGVLGFDTLSGRLDLSPHPFTMGLAGGDVRQTTRTDPDDLLMSVFATMHETGHALYEQGIPHDILDLPIGQVPSLGLHESQSRLWENQVGRSRPFCDFMLPYLKERWSGELGSIDPDDFYRAVNRAERSLIRVTADELTYNLHVALRFELERALFNNELQVADLPEAWNDAMERNLGIRPPDDAHGVLQDIHWSMGSFGYFPTYTLGTIYSAALFSAALRDLGELEEEFRVGKTSRLLDWLREKIHARGYRVEAKELMEEVTGAPPTAAPLIDYLRTKYSEVAGVSL